MSLLWRVGFRSDQREARITGFSRIWH